MRPKLLDLFCCEGGAAMGYSLAGFDVYGVDIEPQRRYPFAFHLGDALDVMRRLMAGEAVVFTHKDGTTEALRLSDFAAVHGSPPCQAYSKTKHMHAVEYPELVEPTRDLFIEAGLPYVIENVPGAPMLDPLILCGTEFGLQARDDDGVIVALRRHRLFESNVWLMGAGGCAHDGTPVAGIYNGARGRSRAEALARRVGYSPTKAVRAVLLGAGWMTLHGQAQAIPPAYTEFIGRQLLAAVGHRTAPA